MSSFKRIELSSVPQYSMAQCIVLALNLQADNMDCSWQQQQKKEAAAEPHQHFRFPSICPLPLRYSVEECLLPHPIHCWQRR